MRLLHVMGFARTTFQNGTVGYALAGWFRLRLPDDSLYFVYVVDYGAHVPALSGQPVKPEAQTSALTEIAIGQVTIRVDG